MTNGGKRCPCAQCIRGSDVSVHHFACMKRSPASLRPILSNCACMRGPLSHGSAAVIGLGRFTGIEIDLNTPPLHCHCPSSGFLFFEGFLFHARAVTWEYCCDYKRSQMRCDDGHGVEHWYGMPFLLQIQLKCRSDEDLQCRWVGEHSEVLSSIGYPLTKQLGKQGVASSDSFIPNPLSV